MPLRKWDTSSMCIESWGQSSFARCLIKVNADNFLKESVTMGILYLMDQDFLRKRFMLSTGGSHLVKKGKTGSVDTNCSGVNLCKATWQPIKLNVRFQPNAHGGSSKNGSPNVSTFAKYGHTKQLNKVVDIPSSSATKKGYPQVPTRLSNILTSNPYDLLSQEVDPEL
ncbi:hypothetical protein Tco_1046417 [Tanacetum coccineum]